MKLNDILLALLLRNLADISHQPRHWKTDREMRAGTAHLVEVIRGSTQNHLMAMSPSTTIADDYIGVLGFVEHRARIECHSDCTLMMFSKGGLAGESVFVAFREYMLLMFVC